MGAKHFVIKAKREANPQGSLARHNHCTCHPKEWGLKKGLRRARRRLDHEIVVLSLREADTETTEVDYQRSDQG